MKNSQTQNQQQTKEKDILAWYETQTKKDELSILKVKEEFINTIKKVRKEEIVNTTPKKLTLWQKITRILGF
jgi:hypothetical protein